MFVYRGIIKAREYIPCGLNGLSRLVRIFNLKNDNFHQIYSR